MATSDDIKVLPTHSSYGAAVDPVVAGAMRIARRWRRWRLAATGTASVLTGVESYNWLSVALWRVPETVWWASVIATIFVAGCVYFAMLAAESWRVTRYMAQQRARAAPVSQS
ncbi:MAG: hypothetical protein K0U93_06850 [Gammaproteobacteria bacterium]|nr:hypothetical protein [Gammaproteobacteria bacterium]